ncbi:MAG: anti-sigma factor [Candidatus Microbacterium phytovorans]|uniref:Anti-sigma factor n=1 Tax=Candidatus Microbacterium phytovorans TaxID=3121374 RepID=A0AAJ6B218_9MICO|nr:anti-sigma factor [Microbacterium sp.]WEK12320.1 MAG: anti-sigma factor [Microbacterium sp.]
MNIQEFAELSAGRALGALSDDDERAFQEALRLHPEWQGIADLDVETAAALGESVAPVAPPLAARSQILGRIRGARETPDAVASDAGFAPVSAAGAAGAAGAAADDVNDTVALDRESRARLREAFAADQARAADEADAAAEAAGAEPPPLPETAAPEEAALRAAAPPTEIIQAIQRKNWTRGLFALVASIALLVGVGWGVGAITDALRTPPEIATLAQIEAAPDAQEASGELSGGGQATLHWSPSVGEAVIVASGLPAIDSDRTFELWFVRDGTPISAGTFDAADGEATAVLAGDVQVGDTVAVTVEQAGGAPDGAPTTDPLVAITPADA